MPVKAVLRKRRACTITLTKTKTMHGGKQGSLMQSIIYNRVLSLIVNRSSFIVKGSPRTIPVQDSQDKYKNIRTFAADNL